MEPLQQMASHQHPMEEQKEWKVASTEFDFIEPDKQKKYHKKKVKSPERSRRNEKPESSVACVRINSRDRIPEMSRISFPY